MKPQPNTISHDRHNLRTTSNTRPRLRLERPLHRAQAQDAPRRNPTRIQPQRRTKQVFRTNRTRGNRKPPRRNTKRRHTNEIPRPSHIRPRPRPTHPRRSSGIRYVPQAIAFPGERPGPIPGRSTGNDAHKTKLQVMSTPKKKTVSKPTTVETVLAAPTRDEQLEALEAACAHQEAVARLEARLNAFDAASNALGVAAALLDRLDVYTRKDIEQFFNAD